MRAAQPVCSAFQSRRNYGSSFCGWCSNHLVDHPFLDATVWSTAGPFIPVGHTDRERIPNPDYPDYAVRESA